MNKKNIIIIDVSKNKREFNGVSFANQREAEKYIENHERPNDLLVTFDNAYCKISLEAFERDFQIVRLDIEILKLIELNNPNSTIQKLYKKSISENIQRLKKNKFIEMGLITERGSRFLRKIENEN